MPALRLALLGILALTVAVSAEAGTRVEPGGNGKIAFASARDRNFEIYSIYPDATGTERLTSNPAADSDPAWSPEGRRIAFKSNRAGNDDIWRMSEDGSGLVQLTTDAARDDNPTWSAGGRNIAFVSTRDGDAEIFVMNEDGTGQDQLTHNDVVDATPAWSPDDTRIAFRSERDGNSEIYVMNVDGNGATRLTNDPASDTGPNWSPDGKKIAFASMRDGNWEIYVMDSDGSHLVRLTRNLDVDLDPAWSPDGELIAFTTNRDGNNEIYEMNADGTGQARLTTDAGEDTTPDWQWIAVQLPKPKAVSDAEFTGRWKESEYFGGVTVSGSVPRQIGLRFEIRRGRQAVVAKTMVLRKGTFRRLLAVPRTALPGRYMLDVKQVSGPSAVRPQREPLRLAPPAEGVVSRSWSSTTIAGPPLRILPRTSDAYANFRFAVMPRSGRSLVARWYREGTLQGAPRRKERSLLVVAGIYVTDGFLPRGEYTCVLSAGPTVVDRVTFRIS